MGEKNLKVANRFSNIEYEGLRGIDKAAILINYLGQDAIKVLFVKMDDADIRKLIHLVNHFHIQLIPQSNFLCK